MVERVLLLKDCKAVIPCADCKPLLRTSVFIEDGLVAYVGDSPPPGARRGEVMDCKNLIAVPCFYNAHTHVAMVAVRGVFEGYDLKEWLKLVWGVERKLTPQTVYMASLLGVLELASNGVCGFIDMYFYPEETAKAVKEVGLRAALGPVVMGKLTDVYRAVEAIKLFALKYRNDPLIKPIVNVHSIYATPLEAVEAVSDVAGDLGLPLHIHVSETVWEVKYARERYGTTPVQLLYRLGALTQHTIAVHLNWLEREDIELLGRVKPIAVNCPTTSMKLGSGGLFPLYELADRGVRVAIGTDGPATNNALDVLLEAKLAALLQSYARREPRADAARLVFRAATEGASKLLGGTGSIRVGEPADIVVIDSRIPSLAENRLIESLVYGYPASVAVKYTIVNGSIVYCWRWREELMERMASIRERLSEWLDTIIHEQAGVEAEPPCSPPEAC